MESHPRETLSKRKFKFAPASLLPSRNQHKKWDKKNNTNATYDWRCKLPRTLGDCNTASTAWENCWPNLSATSETALTLTKLSWDTRWVPVKSIHQSSEIPLCDSQNVPSIPPTPETACRWAPHAAAFPWRVRRTHAPAQQETQSHSQRQGQPLHPAPSARQGIPCQLQHFLDSRSFPTWNLRLWNPGRQKLHQNGQSFSLS